MILFIFLRIILDLPLTLLERLRPSVNRLSRLLFQGYIYRLGKLLERF